MLQAEVQMLYNCSSCLQAHVVQHDRCTGVALQQAGCSQEQPEETLSAAVCPVDCCRAESRNSESSFLTGFVMGGVVFGALGFLLAPQVGAVSGCST